MSSLNFESSQDNSLPQAQFSPTRAFLRFSLDRSFKLLGNLIGTSCTTAIQKYCVYMTSLVVLYINKLKCVSVFFLQRLVKYVLQQDTPTSLEDALKIAAAYTLPTVKVYVLRMIDLIDKERV